MSFVWPDAPPSWIYAGHPDKGGEREQIIDRIATSAWDLSSYKPTDTTIISNATLTDDPHLFFDADANAVYHVDMDLYFSSVAALINVDIAGPSGSASIGARYTYMTTTVPTGGGGFKMFTFGTTGASFAVGGFPSHGTTVIYPIHLRGIFTTAAVAGRCNFRWSQGSSTASNTVLYAGSTMRVTRLS